LYAALVAFVLLVLVPIGLIVRLPFKQFIQTVSEPLSIAFSTASSEAALPKAMENLEKMGIPRKVVAFVLPTGYSFNLDGTTLYLSLASVFVAQTCGVDLSLSQQIQMCLILMLTSKGVAGVRGASFLILVSTVASLGLEPEKAFAILAIDAVMDMGRTTVNVLGNCLATFVVAKWEGEI
jgi:proton glutamate symport protein